MSTKLASSRIFPIIDRARARHESAALLGSGVALAVLALGGCAQHAPAPAAAAVEVGVVTVTPRSITVTNHLPGRTAAYRVAEVRPQVTGIVQKRLFVEGSEVKAGEQLFQIDSASYKAALRSGDAALARAQARLGAAKLLAQRYEPLIAANAVSRQEYDEALAARTQAEADVAAAQAQVENARIDVVYTQVRAPISGRIGRALVTEGALVTSGQPSALALVQQLDPIYVDITQSSAELLHLQRQLASGEVRKEGHDKAAVTLTLEDGSEYPERGELQFSEVSVDPGTGAVALRAVFPNPRRELLPGMFVRTELTQGETAAALLVPQRGVSRNTQGEAIVMLVDANEHVAARVIKADRAVGNEWLVSAGLSPGDRVVVDGLQKIKPGILVRAVPVQDTRLDSLARR